MNNRVHNNRRNSWMNHKINLEQLQWTPYSTSLELEKWKFKLTKCTGKRMGQCAKVKPWAIQ